MAVEINFRHRFQRCRCQFVASWRHEQCSLRHMNSFTQKHNPKLSVIVPNEVDDLQIAAVFKTAAILELVGA